ncbi:hypothetical protein, partial [Streptomyces sp. NPDC007070]|uniref:hypothetical protein n=1 Tax=Streptomyces sp. NPDC007070 TaxID=3154312 RepID=UPI0033DD5224
MPGAGGTERDRTAGHGVRPYRCGARTGVRRAVPYEAAPLKLFTPSDWWWAGTVSPKGMEGR